MDTNEALTQAVKEAAVERDGRMTLACPAAFRIAEEFSVDIVSIGQLCNKLKIKIVQCQLGCFK